MHLRNTRACSAVIALAAAALVTACGSAAAGTTAAAPATQRAHRVAPAATPVAVRSGVHPVAIRLGGGRASMTVRLREPAGAIRLYRLSAPRGARIAGSVQLPGITVPLVIGTNATEFTRCRSGAVRVVCAVGEEACPMPAGVWRLRLRKLAGPAGRVTLWFRVGT